MKKIDDIIYAIKNIKLIKDNNKKKNEQTKKIGKNKQKEIKLENNITNEIIKEKKISVKLYLKTKEKEYKKRKRNIKKLKMKMWLI